MTTLLNQAQLKNIQAIGEAQMVTKALLYRKQPQAKDAADPYGDDIVTFAQSPVTVYGWLVTQPTQQMDVGEGEVRAISTHRFRVKAGTNIGTGDRLEIGDDSFIVTDATTENTWPEWQVCFLRGYESGSK